MASGATRRPGCAHDWTSPTAGRGHDDAAVAEARAASDIDASKHQIAGALDPATATLATAKWAFTQSVARARGAADRLLASSRHALDASDPVTDLWRDVHAGCRLAVRISTRFRRNEHLSSTGHSLGERALMSTIGGAQTPVARSMLVTVAYPEDITPTCLGSTTFWRDNAQRGLRALVTMTSMIAKRKCSQSQGLTQQLD